MRDYARNCDMASRIRCCYPGQNCDCKSESKIDRKHCAYCVQHRPSLICATQFGCALYASVGEARGDNAARTDDRSRDHPQAVLCRTQPAQDDGSGDKHPERIGSVVQHAIHGIGDMPSHAASFRAETMECHRPRMAGTTSSASVLRGSLGLSFDHPSRKIISAAVTATENECQQERENQTWREGLFLGYARDIDNTYDRSVLSLLDPRHLVLLCKQFEDRLLDPHAPVEICIWNGKAGQLAQGRIELPFIFGIG